MRIKRAFTEFYQRVPEGVWHAPGRVNLIGEHTDYNEGLVLPFALAQGVTLAAARREDDLLELHSLQEPDAGVRIPIGRLVPGAVPGWAAYAAGVVWALRSAGRPIGGTSLLIDSDLPRGAGLSSSAALECAVALAVCDLHAPTADRQWLARVTQHAENDFVGMPCGILDQSASLLCIAGHALLLDCRTGRSCHVPMNLAGLALVVIDTRAVHELVDGEYAARRAECEQAARLCGVGCLREVDDLPAALRRLPDQVLRRRVEHVVGENQRVAAIAGLLRSGRVGEVGPLLTASHVSLRELFEVSWPEADVAVQQAVAAGALGARMMGGGFGGSVITLVPAGRLATVHQALARSYAAKGWAQPRLLIAEPSAGARRLTDNTEYTA